MYWAGDTFATPDVLVAIEKEGQPDIFIPHLGRVGTTGPLGPISMGIDEAIDMAHKIGAKRLQASTSKSLGNSAEALILIRPESSLSFSCITSTVDWRAPMANFDYLY